MTTRFKKSYDKGMLIGKLFALHLFDIAPSLLFRVSAAELDSTLSLSRINSDLNDFT